MSKLLGRRRIRLEYAILISLSAIGMQTFPRGDRIPPRLKPKMLHLKYWKLNVRISVTTTFTQELEEYG